ncbi:MAG: YeeE/YedE thiosulfate transporter family protein [Bacteroidota bacterium]
MDLLSTPIGFADFISQPWHWSISGVMIALIVFLMTWMGRKFGISTTFETVCSALGASRFTDFFKRDLKNDVWRVMFVLGAIIGGFISVTFLASPETVDISIETRNYLASVGVSYPEADHTGRGYVNTDLLNFNSVKGVLLALGGGFLIGFGTRYARGCTSGHAITGLSHLQKESLITVIGFFIGGLVMTHLILPFLF